MQCFLSYNMQSITAILYVIQAYQELLMNAFKISPKGETDNKTIRFPLELIEKIEKAIVGQDITFSRFVILACKYALNNMEK